MPTYGPVSVEQQKKAHGISISPACKTQTAAAGTVVPLAVSRVPLRS